MCVGECLLGLFGVYLRNESCVSLLVRAGCVWHICVFVSYLCGAYVWCVFLCVCDVFVSLCAVCLCLFRSLCEGCVFL